jgi:hypothetical protein
MAKISPAGAVGVQAMQARFVENGAGTYIADFTLPAGSSLYDIVVDAEALWTAGTSAALIVGEVADDDGFLASINLKATDLLAGESISLQSTQVRGGNAGAYLVVGTSTHIAPRWASNTAERMITAKVTSVGAGTAGRTRVTVLYVPPMVTTVTQ